MFPQLLIRSGGYAGRRIPLQGSVFRLGRRPDLEICLHPERDLEVSGLHAELRAEAHGWSLRDLGSRNGTFLNGRIVGSTPTHLKPGDEIRLGPRGPVLEIQVLRVRHVAHTQVTGPSPVPAQLGGDGSQEGGRSRSSSGLVVGVLALAVLLVGAAIWTLASQRERASWEQERAELTALADSLLSAETQTNRNVRSDLEELEEALRRSRTELEEIRAELSTARAQQPPRERTPPREPTPTPAPPPPPSGPDPRLEEIERRLRDAMTALERQQLAAALDFEAIEEANRPAVALLFAEHPDGTVVTGTAFAMEPGGRLITSRHVVLGEGVSTPPLRIAIQFSDSSQIFPGRLVAASSDWDVAIVDVENIVGTVPVVAGLNLRPDTLRAGTPLATLGFPLGGESATTGDGSTAPARPLLSAGILLERSGQELRFQGYGERGASGSPVFDADGRVVAILMGGIREDDRRIVIAVPAPVAATLLQNAAGAGRP